MFKEMHIALSDKAYFTNKHANKIPFYLGIAFFVNCIFWRYLHSITYGNYKI